MLRETIGAPSIQFSKLRELTHADSAETAIGLLPVLRISQENMSTEKIVYCGFALYHKLLDASAVAHEDELFFASADAELRDACDQFLHSLIDEDKKSVADRLLDYRHYYDYDMEVDDLGDDGEVKATSRVDRQSGKFSGGENQSPYFIAILASYLRAYKRHDTRSKLPSLALVPIDEAFSKLSGERIKDCIEAMKSLDLQGVFSMSTGNIPYAFEHCDSLVIVAKEEKRSR